MHEIPERPADDDVEVGKPEAHEKQTTSTFSGENNGVNYMPVDPSERREPETTKSTENLVANGSK